MSHATVLVITNPGQTIESLMARFSEEIEVPAYTEPCYCSAEDRAAREECHGSGSRTSTYNPESHWDWWQLGGRYNDRLIPLPGKTGTSGDTSWASGERVRGHCDAALFEDIDFQRMWTENGEKPWAFAVLTPDGEWHQRGQLGWFGAVHDEQEPDRWAAEFTELLSTCQPGQTLSIVDYHI